MPDDFAELLTTDTEWWQNFSAALKILEDFSAGQLVLWPVDDFLEPERYVPCPRRRTHLKIVDCWLCFGDWAWGRAALSELIAPDETAA